MKTSTNRFSHRVRGGGRESLKVKKGDIWSQAVSSGLVRDMKFGYDEDRRVSREAMLIIPCKDELLVSTSGRELKISAHATFIKKQLFQSLTWDPESALVSEQPLL